MGLGKSPKTQHQTQQFKPPPGSERLFRNVIGGLEEEFDKGPPGFFPGNTVAGFTDLQKRGLDLAPGVINRQLQGTDSISNALNFTLNDLLDPQSNPNLQKTADSAVNTVFRNFNENVLPNIEDQSIANGGFGSTRSGVATGTAASRAVDQAGDISSRIFNNAYQNSLNNFTNTLLGSGQILRGLNIPAQTAIASGSVQQGQDQQNIDAEKERFDFNENARQNQLQQYIRLLMGNSPGGSTITQSGARGNPFTQGLGTVALLASLGGLFNPSTSINAVGDPLSPLGGFYA